MMMYSLKENGLKTNVTPSENIQRGEKAEEQWTKQPSWLNMRI